MKTKRKIIHIDQGKCDGCALCIPSCVEGAIRVVDGKARLVEDQYCDGLGACLGECPRGHSPSSKKKRRPSTRST